MANYSPYKYAWFSQISLDIYILLTPPYSLPFPLLFIVIADPIVEMSFGTGCLKITPAHDVNDYETAKRHNLPLINIMNKDASINSIGGSRYAGLDRFECRKRIWVDITEAGLAIKADPHLQVCMRGRGRGRIVIECLVDMLLTASIYMRFNCLLISMYMQRVPRSQRGGEVIEPMVSAQW